MDRTTAHKIANTITNDQLLEMFNRAKAGIKNWKQVSTVNKGITKGTAWNILAKDFDLNEEYHILSKRNMIREFGDFLPEELKPVTIKKIKKDSIVHQNPEF
jgi:hypothetical protein